MAMRKNIPMEVRSSVACRDLGRCRYCGRIPYKSEIDHIVPVARFGSNDPSNLVLACSICNHAKGSRLIKPMSLAELLEIAEGRAQVLPYVEGDPRPHGTKHMDRTELLAWVATGQRISKKAMRALQRAYPRGMKALCDKCSREFLVGVDGRLVAERATLRCSRH